MSVFDRFRRNRQQSVLPDEVRDYYQSENRQRRGVAVGLAIAALIATVAVATALFFGGRFLYDQIRGDDNKTQDTSSTNTTDEGGQQGGEGGQNPQPATPPASTPPQGSQTPAPAPQPATPPAQSTPNLGDDTTELPHTGDEGM